MESRIVSAVAVSVNTENGRDSDKFVEKAMSDEVLKCNQEGISTEEKNSDVIRSRMAAARTRALEEWALLSKPDTGEVN